MAVLHAEISQDLFDAIEEYKTELISRREGEVRLSTADFEEVKKFLENMEPQYEKMAKQTAKMMLSRFSYKTPNKVNRTTVIVELLQAGLAHKRAHYYTEAEVRKYIEEFQFKPKPKK